MKTKKIVHYQVAVSRTFQSTHPKKGQPTYFVEKIIVGQIDVENFTHIVCSPEYDSEIVLTCNEPKLHTIRKNYPMWVKRMKKVAEGKAVIDLFYWTLPGGRYNPENKKVVFATLDKDSGCGVQELEFGQIKGSLIPMFEGMANRTNCIELAKNDGLSLEDFKDWFKNYDLSEPMAIIQFTKFRY